MRYLDTGSTVVMGITLFLFVVALFVKGWTHDLLLEAGVFLISVKLMMMVYKTSQTGARQQRMLEEILQHVRSEPSSSSDPAVRP